MDDWLGRGGPLGGILDSLSAGYPVADRLRVRQLVMAIPDAAGEVAYTAKVFPSRSALPRLADAAGVFSCLPVGSGGHWPNRGLSVPALDSVELYRLADKPVYLPHVVVGLG